MPQNDAGSAFLYAQIQRRMIESGEWDRYDLEQFDDLRPVRLNIFSRISALFSHQLNETGWTDDMHHRSKGEFTSFILRLPLC